MLLAVDQRGKHPVWSVKTCLVADKHYAYTVWVGALGGDVGLLQGSLVVALYLEVLVALSKWFVFVGQGDLG